MAMGNSARQPSTVAQVELAREVAHNAHHGQLDKAGAPYIGHPARIALALHGAGHGPEIVATGWLHDVIEDTPVTSTDLLAVGLEPVIVDAVIALSRAEGQQPGVYYSVVSANPIARIVKRFDIADNLNADRLAALDLTARQRLEAKYAYALAVLDELATTTTL